jgi:hypothetical protein
LARSLLLCSKPGRQGRLPGLLGMRAPLKKEASPANYVRRF